MFCHSNLIHDNFQEKSIDKIKKVRRSLKRSSRKLKGFQMTRGESTITETTMDPEINHIAPLATLPTTPMEADIIFEQGVSKKRGGTFPRMAHFDVPEDTPPESQNGTLKASETRRPQRQNGSLKGPWNKKNRGRGVPVVEADTAKVLEMYLKRRSKSLNDAVLTREYFAQEKKRKGRSMRNNTVSICSTLSTDSTTSEVNVQAQVTMETTSDAVNKTVFSRESVTQKSFHEAMKCSIMEESSAMEQSADDELSSSDETSPRSRSAPSTLRMQVRRDTKDGTDTLKLHDRENGNATLTRDGYKRDSKKEPRRKRSFLDKAKQIMRSPSTSRKIVRTPSATQRYEEKEREREEKEREKERQKKEKEEKELLEKKLKEMKEREKEKLKEMERRLKEAREREKERKEREKKEREELERKSTRHHARNEVHSEMKKTGFTARLRQSFRRSSRDKHRAKEHLHAKPAELPPPLPPPRTDSQQHKDVKPKRWPSLTFKRKSRKSASTPTDESGACATTPSDTASMDFEYFASRVDHTRSLNDCERRRLIIEMRRGANQENSGNASDSQILDRGQGAAHPPLSQATSHDSFGSFASSEGSERPERPKTLAFRRTRAERAQRGLNNVIRLDSTTPGHVRRDVDTAVPLLPGAPLALGADDLVRDGPGFSRPSGGPGVNGGADGDDRNVTDSWTESGDGSDIPFDQQNQAQREEYFKRIADRLAMIGDQALADYEFGENGTEPGADQQRAVRSTCSTETYASCAVAAGGATAAASFRDYAADYVEIGQRIQTDVDGLQMRRRSLALFPAQMVMGVIINDTYQSFCTTMQSIVGQDVGWEQLAIVFKFTKVAVKAAHSMGKHASSIKDNSVRFIGDRFAVWLDSQGGWGSVVPSDDSDSIHEESEID